MDRTVAEAGTITSIKFKEFLEIATPKLQSRDYQEQMKKVFQLIDEEDTGKIDFEALKNVSCELGECYTDEELTVSAYCAGVMHANLISII